MRELKARCQCDFLTFDAVPLCNSLHPVDRNPFTPFVSLVSLVHLSNCFICPAFIFPAFSFSIPDSARPVTAADPQSPCIVHCLPWHKPTAHRRFVLEDLKGHVLQGNHHKPKSHNSCMIFMNQTQSHVESLFFYLIFLGLS